jgi:acyl-CoA thioester hydrolase
VTASAAGPTTGRIEGGRHVLPLRIYYEDTDAQGIVYYATWLRFLERGRTELLRMIGLEHSALRAESGINWVVRRCTIDYLKPARLDETVDIVTGCGEMRGASLDMIQEARRGDDLLVRAGCWSLAWASTASRRGCRFRHAPRWGQLPSSGSRPAHAIFGYKALTLEN